MLCRRRRAFTLVELLVVIGIIAALLAILLPSLSRARSEARKLVCMSNQRQIAVAWNLYVCDYHGQMPLAWPDAGAFGSFGLDQIPWVIGVHRAGVQPALVFNVGGDPRDKYIRGGCLFKYLPDTRIYRCPDNPIDFDLNIHYGMNGYLNGIVTSIPPYILATRLVQIKHLATTFLTIDQEDDDFDGDIKGVLCVGAHFWDNSTGQPAAVHNGGSCLSFLDGHVEYIRWPKPRSFAKEAPMLLPYRGD